MKVSEDPCKYSAQWLWWEFLQILSATSSFIKKYHLYPDNNAEKIKDGTWNKD